MKFIVDKIEFKYNRQIALSVTALFFILFTPVLSMAQNTKPVKDNAAVIVTGIPTARDSGTVEQLFFSALSKKAVEDNRDASTLFSKILQIDPSNDASMYELAKLDKM